MYHFLAKIKLTMAGIGNKWKIAALLLTDKYIFLFRAIIENLWKVM